MPRLCAFGCKTHDATRHRFPSSKKFPQQFKAWVTAVGGKLEQQSDYDCYKNSVVCHKHFEDSDMVRNNRLNRLAVCKQWVAATGNEDLIYLPIVNLHKSKYVCGKHFRPRDFKKKKTQVRKKAVPSIDIAAIPLTDNMFENFPLHAAKNATKRIIISDHNYSSEKPAFKVNTWIYRIDAQLPETGDSINADTFEETGDSIEADTFDHDSPPSPVQEIEAEVVTQGVKEQKLFSWQKTELIETDDAGDLFSAPVPEKLALPDDDVTLSFCDPEPPSVPREPQPPSVPCEPAAVVPEDIDYRCKNCEALVDGYHYWCVSCGLGALCGACAASLTHDEHFVLRAPKGTSKSQTRAVLIGLRQQLLAENLLTLYEFDENGVKMEIKLESEASLTLPDTLEPDPLGQTPLAETGEIQFEIPAVDTLSESQTVTKIFGATATDTGVQYVGEKKFNHHQFKRPRLTEHDKWRPKPEYTEKIPGHTLKHLTNIVKDPKTSQMIKVIDPERLKTVHKVPSNLRTLKIVPKHQLNVLKTSPISISKKQLGKFTLTLQKIPNRLRKTDPNRPKVISKTQAVSKGKFCPLKVTSEPVALGTVIINSGDYVDESLQFLEEEHLISDSEHRDLLEKELDNDKRLDQNKTTSKDRVRDIESEINNSDDDDLDKDYRVDEEDLSDDDSMYETDEVSNRGVGRRTRNATETVVRGPWEEMLQKSTSNATVTLQPLTSLEISKWTADKKRRRED